MLNVVEKKDNIIAYERELKIMSGQAPDGENSFKRIKDFIEATGGLLAIICVVVAATIYVVASITSHGKDIDNLYTKINEINESSDIMNEKLDVMSELVKSDHEIFIELSAVNREEPAYNIKLKDIYEVRVESISNEEYLANPLWETDSIIASDFNGDTVYKAEDLYNTPIITSYLDGDNEVYFYGKFNENNHWNGKCILNVYHENNLVSIFEGVYDDGELFSYKCVAEEENTWIVNDRINQGSYNSGETWIYTKSKEFIKDFELNNFKEKQISTVDKFLVSRDERLLSYYKGNTSNGFYNDVSGYAYLVNYKDNGNVNHLYIGKFSNGKEHDSTGNAWSISWGYADDGYYYYNGTFSNGNHGKTPKDWSPMTPEEISSIVNPDNFNCPLTGLVDNQ